MWELISSNKKKSLMLFAAMGIVLMLLGYLIGGAYASKEGSILGITAAFFVWVILSFVSYFAGSHIMLAVSKAHEITPEAFPKLYNIVEEMKIASNLQHMPKIYLIDEEMPNAFAAGRSPDNSAIAVTAGLVSSLNRDELQGVIAHEVSHIINRDVLFMTFAGTMLGSIVFISDMYLRGMRYSSYRYSSNRDRKSRSSGGQTIFAILAVLFAIIGPVLAQLLYFAISRKREYLADATAVRLTRYPEGLASALEKISESTADLSSANKITAAFYFVNPLKKKGFKLNDLSSTHPPVSERIKILRAIAGGAAYINYQSAFNSVKGKQQQIIPESGLKDAALIPLRNISPSGEDLPAMGELSPGVNRKRSVGNVILKGQNYKFLTCSCGLKLKIPPGFGTNQPVVICPKCGNKNPVNCFSSS